MKRPAWSILNALFGALFVFSATLQYNDPDPLPWMGLYIAAGSVSFLACWRRPAWIAPAIVGAAGASWLAVYFYHGAWRVEWNELFTEWQMKNEQVLEAREMLGLGIVVGWMAVLTLVAWRTRARG